MLQITNMTYQSPQTYRKDLIFSVSYLLFMLGILALRNVFLIAIPVIIMLAGTALFLLLCTLFASNTSILVIVLSCIPFAMGFQYKYALLLCILALIVKNYKNIKLSIPLLLAGAMFVWEILHIPFETNFSVNALLRSFAELFLFAVLTMISFEKSLNMKLLIRLFSLSVVGTCLVMIFILIRNVEGGLQYLFSFSSSVFRFGSNPVSKDNYALSFNANQLGFVCILSIIPTLWLIKIKQGKPIDFILCGCSVIFGLLTLSRTFLLCLCCVVFWLMFCNKNMSANKIIRNGIIVLAGCVVMLIIIKIFFPSIITYFLRRFTEKDQSNGRIDLFIFYFKHIFSSFIYCVFGIGLVNYSHTLTSIYGSISNVPHNGFEEAWVCWGIIGLALVLGLLYWIYKRKPKTVRITTKSLFVISMISCMLGQLISSGTDMLALSMCYLLIDYGVENTSVENILLGGKVS